MKSKLILSLIMLVSAVTFGQKSPAETVTGTIAEASVEIKYSSPRVKERTIYGNLVPYAKVWRAGANENTTISFDKAVKVNGQDLAAGTYGFFIIPNENDNWIAIFSNKNDAWGSSSYKEADDALRVDVKAKSLKESKENLTYKVTEKGVKFVWADKGFMMKVK
ncbi:DUF2911 domain-containing protein [Urechidicola vernalis]|uniref:DUF2911 domain-containing protein n=1 Tax=Urechidicola vernalis TaxID=3075600 RepID=A0ABU2Y9Q7_9FLAO|nr:DUF2911 domain-containing protein [Urechidicola sp. P050]MDT0553798.1 DUF2911 domain-containing protein [Urechidicola sp. P050]